MPESSRFKKRRALWKNKRTQRKLNFRTGEFEDYTVRELRNIVETAVVASGSDTSQESEPSPATGPKSYSEDVRHKDFVKPEGISQLPGPPGLRHLTEVSEANAWIDDLCLFDEEDGEAAGPPWHELEIGD